MDRSLNRILSLPLFDDEFVRALKLVRLDHVEFWLAVVDDRSIAVDSKLAGLVSASPEDQKAKDLLLNRLDLLTMLAHLIEKSRPRIEGEIATDLGFGMSFGSAKSGPPDQGEDLLSPWVAKFLCSLQRGQLPLDLEWKWLLCRMKNRSRRQSGQLAWGRSLRRLGMQLRSTTPLVCRGSPGQNRRSWRRSSSKQEVTGLFVKTFAPGRSSRNGRLIGSWACIPLTPVRSQSTAYISVRTAVVQPWSLASSTRWAGSAGGWSWLRQTWRVGG